MATPNSHSVSAWAPFAYRPFTLLWTATLVSNIGTWVDNAGSAWLMTTLDSSPAIVALVQAASALPVFLFALIAGALADRADKRRFLLVSNVFLGAVIAILAALVALGMMTPWLLLLFTFVVGTGAAFVAPAWQAVVPDLVPRSHLPPAIALNGLGINISRAVGPALAGALIVAIGLASPFALDAISYLAIIGALLLWRPARDEVGRVAAEPVFGAMLTALRHVDHNQPLKATLLRAVGFFSFASAYWALLPVVARQLPDGGAATYGVMLGAVGAGAVVGAVLMPSLRQRIDTNVLAGGGGVATAVALALFALESGLALALVAALLAGLGWITMLTSLNVSAQMALPDWIRARGLSIMIMALFGCMAGGSILWGQIATRTSVTVALLVAAAGAIIAVVATWRCKLGQGEQRDLTPAMAWADPMVAPTFDAHPARGPVLVTIRYRIDGRDTAGFLRAIRELSHERYRDGAYDWGVYQDVAAPDVWIEWFFVANWAEHLRQHTRVTRHDDELHQVVAAYHRGAAPPDIHHYAAPLE